MFIDHLQLAMPVGGEERVRRYFGDILGMAEDVKPEPLQSRGGCWFRKGEVLLHLGVESDFSAQKKAHPAFVVSDLRGLASRLEAEGYSVIWDDVLPDRLRFFTSDPFGNRIEFMDEGDGFSQR